MMPAAQPGQAGRSADPWGAPRSKPVSWHDPLALAVAGAELSGREFLQAIIDGRLPPPPIATLIGAELVSVGEGEAVFRCTPDESACNPIGIIHGGLLCTLLDSAAGCAAHTMLPVGVGYGSIEIKVSFLKPLRADSGQMKSTGTRYASVAASRSPKRTPGTRTEISLATPPPPSP